MTKANAPERIWAGIDGVGEKDWREREWNGSRAIPATEYLRADIAEDALEALVTTAKMLIQNAEGCAVNHYGADFETHGMPGWLADCRRDIDAADAILARATNGGRDDG